jgi:hypothetical protein
VAVGIDGETRADLDDPSGLVVDADVEALDDTGLCVHDAAAAKECLHAVASAGCIEPSSV